MGCYLPARLKLFTFGPLNYIIYYIIFALSNKNDMNKYIYIYYGFINCGIRPYLYILYKK